MPFSGTLAESNDTQC